MVSRRLADERRQRSTTALELIDRDGSSAALIG
jgi:hypothetical protein